jgi:hypothetical protein
MYNVKYSAIEAVGSTPRFLISKECVWFGLIRKKYYLDLNWYLHTGSIFWISETSVADRIKYHIPALSVDSSLVVEQVMRELTTNTNLVELTAAELAVTSSQEFILRSRNEQR